VVGLAMAVAIAGIDLLYATVGLAGIGNLLNGGALRLWLGLVSASILVAIGARTLGSAGKRVSASSRLRTSSPPGARFSRRSPPRRSTR
jgi:putative LysE/RhtB family amino acid efflux pump